MSKLERVAATGACVGSALALHWAGKKAFASAVYFLGKDDQLRVEGFTEVYVINGPGVKVLNPLSFRSAKVQKAVTLGQVGYVKLRNTLDGSERVVKGPCLLFLGAYEEVLDEGEGTTLTNMEYMRIEDKVTGATTILKGPCIWFPEVSEKGSKGSGITLTSTDYVVVSNKVSGSRTVLKGPSVWFPAPNEEGKKGAGVTLTKTEYIIVEDTEKGEKRIVKGPCIWFPGPYEVNLEKKNGVSLEADEFVRIRDTSTGERWLQKGKALIFLEPTWALERKIEKAFALKAYEYVRLVDKNTGKISMHQSDGKHPIFPTVDEYLFEDDGAKMSAIDLKVNQYVKILDQSTGIVRVEQGCKQVFLKAYDKVLGSGPKKAIQVDDEHAVLVRDEGSGQVRLITEKCLFVPGPDESIEEVRELIKLADHESMIVKDNDGVFHFYFGDEKKRQKSGKPRSFFLPPYCEIVKLCWSRGRRRERRDLYIERFDCRAQYMNFEFTCRTKDNVELLLEGTFFWEVVDLPLMVQNTGDTSGDICAHARSQFIKHVARVTLKEFMDDLSIISNKVYQEDTSFYSTRGVKVHSLEVTRYQCADESTSAVLQQIIQETTNRMNRLSQQESENEVKLFKMQGQIEQEKLNKELLAIQHEHAKEEAKVKGQAEADAVAAFMQGLTKDLPKLEDRVLAWQTLRKTDALGTISSGNAAFYYTPQDVNLTIEKRN
eukprot:TRINITY_DN22864_c0_g1_i2.p1 TRINITY_DN22864_c0_g1~~TRINITY_DN22864_c0_g1_i2.p1  ORF type:complete len:715 (-),score=190.35 TRINITY_DN22864_c0_g1_i2:330-2474(-)